MQCALRCTPQAEVNHLPLVVIGNAPNRNAIDTLSEGLPNEAKLDPSGTAIKSLKTAL